MEERQPIFDQITAMADPKALSCLKGFMDRAGVDKYELLERSGMSYAAPYLVYGGQRRLMRDMILQMAVGLRLTVRETGTLLTHFGFDPLDVRQKRDEALVYCLDHEYPFSQVQSFLAGLRLKPLGG